jgi:superfamily II DNA helicase RecQ
VEALRQWRKETSKRQRVPAFRVLTDRTLTALAATRPRDEDELLSVPGIGPHLARKYGQELLGIVAQGG